MPSRVRREADKIRKERQAIVDAISEGDGIDAAAWRHGIRPAIVHEAMRAAIDENSDADRATIKWGFDLHAAIAEYERKVRDKMMAYDRSPRYISQWFTSAIERGDFTLPPERLDEIKKWNRYLESQELVSDE